MQEKAVLLEMLGSDEYPLWQGKPEKGHIFSASDLFLIPFGLFFLGFALFWTWMASSAGGFFGLFGIPFILVGFFLSFGRFFSTAFLRKKSSYIITNKRILCKRGNRINIVDRKNMPPITVNIHKNGCGTITIGTPYYYNRTRGYGYERGYDSSQTIVLENIADVHEVQKILTEE